MKKKNVLTVLLFIPLILFLQPLAFADELDDIHFAIRSRGAQWIAGKTSMSRLPFAERQKRLGLQPVYLTSAPENEVPQTAVTLPATLDWRNNGGNFVTPIRDQGSCGSCWAFATTAVLESATLLGNNTPGIDLNLAEQILLSCSGAGNCENGGSVSIASDFIRNTGLPLEGCYPYMAADRSCSNACLDWQASAYKIPSWSWVATIYPTVSALKNALVTNGPLVTTMAVYNDFFSYRSGIYSYTHGSLAGSHAITLIGYDDTNQYFIVKNSWGAGWGEAGFFRIAYTELNSVVRFGQYTIAYAQPAPSCSYAIDPANQSFTAAGGPGSVNVTTSSICPWTAASNVDWIIVTSGVSGAGNGTVNYSVAANTGTASRTGTLSVAGITFTVTQAGTSFVTPPPATTLVSPSGAIATNTPTYIWNAVPGSTWYYLWVDDAAGIKIQKWYTAADAGCAPGTGTCSATPPPVDLVPGNATWWIQTWNSAGYGPWSIGMSFVENPTPPGAATLVSPSGAIATNTPTYIWNAVANSTWYYLWVDDATGIKIQKWYTAADAGCASGTGTCSVALATTLVSGSDIWWIQTWNGVGYGPWSTGMAFTTP